MYVFYLQKIKIPIKNSKICLGDDSLEGSFGQCANRCLSSNSFVLQTNNVLTMQMLLSGNWPKLTYACNTTSSPQTLLSLLSRQGCLLSCYKQSISIPTSAWFCVAEMRSEDLCFGYWREVKKKQGGGETIGNQLNQWRSFTQLIACCLFLHITT